MMQPKRATEAIHSVQFGGTNERRSAHLRSVLNDYFGDKNSRGNGDGLARQETRLLVVDDDDVDRERIGRYIKKFKMPIVVVDARNGSEAIQKAIKEEVDIILIDYQLGDMTGTDVLAELRKNEKTAVPTIMVTGMGDEETAIEAMRLGVFDYLPKKNLTAESLMAVLLSALNASDLEKQLHDAQDHLKRLSLYDTLTGLPNRNLFFDRLKQAVLGATRKESEFTLLMIDLNLFKEVNDTLGHAAGDEVLTVIGDRLQAIARKSDTVARLGGDEFVCILHDVQNVEVAAACAEKISAAISQPIAISGRVIQVGSSIGIAQFPTHGQDQTTLLSNADHAMYRAKKTNQKIVVYKEQEGELESVKLPISQSLYKAIKEKELFLEYQPKINLSSQNSIGAEALVRWNSPEFGLVMPGNFISIAERSSLIENLTYLTFEMALDQLAKWKRDSYITPLALNLSARMLDDRNLPKWLSDQTTSRHLSPNLITLEITETTLASSNSLAHKVLAELKESGFRISIDDFGSGFTSFKSIRNVDIAEIKIDRLYVNQIDSRDRDAGIVRSIISLAESLGIQVVAEGVETPSQWAVLQSLGCEYAQGFGIARPMTADCLRNWSFAGTTH